MTEKQVKYRILLIQTSYEARFSVYGKNYYQEWEIFPHNKVNIIERDTVIVEALSLAVRCLREGKDVPPAISAAMTLEGELSTEPLWNFKQT